MDAGKPELLDMKPILEVVNEALKAAGKISRPAALDGVGLLSAFRRASQ